MIKNIRTKYITRILTVLLAVLSVIATLAYPVGAETERFDYANGRAYNETADAVELLGMLTGDIISSAENNYIKTLGISPLRYSTRIPDSNTGIDIKDGQCTVKFTAYSYTANNGKKVTFTPCGAIYGGKTYKFESSDGTTYTAVFPTSDSQTVIKIEYNVSFDIDATDAGDLLNLAYEEAVMCAGKLDTYDKALKEYSDKKAAYEKYLTSDAEYLAKLAEYNNSIEYAKKYDTLLAEYEKYLAELRKYETDKAAYEEYLKKNKQYLEEKETYDKAYAKYTEELSLYKENNKAYLESKEQAEKCDEKLRAMELFYGAGPGSSFYDTLNGGSVMSVLNNKDELVNVAGVREKYVDGAADSTEKLKTLLTEYKNLNGSQTEKFEWYKNNHSKLTSALASLESNMLSIFDASKYTAVLVKAADMGKSDRFCEFIAQIDFIRCYLDDKAKFDSGKTITYCINGTKDFARKTYGEALWSGGGNDAGGYVDEDKSSPAGMTYPVITSVVPTAPTAPTPPTAPVAVIRPEAPKEVKKPDEIKKIDPPEIKAEKPGEQPVKPVFTAIQDELVKLLKTGELKQRSVDTSRLNIVKNQSVSEIIPGKQSDVGSTKIYYVTYYNRDGSILDTARVVNGVPDKLPQTPTYTDEKNIYTFSGWEDFDGRKTDITAIDSNMKLYAGYTVTPREYTVTWKLHTDDVTEKYTYGKLPTHAVPETYTENGDKYEFSAWLPVPVTVTGDAVYTAQYVKVKEYFTVRWNINGVTYDSVCEKGEIPVCPVNAGNIVGAGGKYTFEGWDRQIVTATENTEYTAVVKPVTASERYGVDQLSGMTGYGITENSVEVVVDAKLNNGKTVNIGKVLEYASGNGKDTVLMTDAGVTLDIPSSIAGVITDNDTVITFAETSDGQSSALKELEIKVNGKPLPEGVYVMLDKEDDCISVRGYKSGANAEIISHSGKKTIKTDGVSVLYGFVGVYTVELEKSENVDVNLNLTSAAPGDKIVLDVKENTGYTANVKVTTKSGEDVKLDDGNVFVMPRGGADVTVLAERIKCNVKFYVDGEIYKTETFMYGDDMILPAAPTKDGDEKVKYVFGGWTPLPATAVTGDMSYYGNFNKIVISDPNDKEGLPSLEGYITKIMLYAVAVIAVVATAIVAIAVGCTSSMRKKGNKKRYR